MADERLIFDSKERVAFDLMKTVMMNVPRYGKKEDIFALYSECLEVVKQSNSSGPKEGRKVLKPI